MIKEANIDIVEEKANLFMIYKLFITLHYIHTHYSWTQM